MLGNPRFLILPWVRVGNLASKALSLATRGLADDWKARHGYRPVLVETFVDPARFDGACYRAANWRHLGETAGKRSARTPKSVFVQPLDKDFRAILVEGRRRAPRPAPPGGSADALAERWGPLIDAVVAVARDFDRHWQRRRRSLNTLLVVLFVFRLVLAKNRQGYGATLAELWDQCRRQGVPLPQPSPVSPSAMCAARAKVHENLFRALHAELLRRAGETAMGPRWKGHRLFAVDGTKLNLPRPLVAAGYRTPSDNAHYPQGLLSCLYRLRSRIPVDFDLVAHADEKKGRAVPSGRAGGQRRGGVRPGLFLARAALRTHRPGPASGVPASGERQRRGGRVRQERRRRPGGRDQHRGGPRGRPRQDPAAPGEVRDRRLRVCAGHHAAGPADVVADLSDLYHERWGVGCTRCRSN